MTSGERADETTPKALNFRNTYEGTRSFSLSDSFQVGVYFGNLRHVCEEAKKSEIKTEKVLDPISNIHKLLKSRDIDTEVADMIEEMRREVENIDDDLITESELIEYLSKRAISMPHLLNRELEQQQRIPVSNTGILDIDKLVDSPERLFSPAVWDWLDERPKSDLREASKTIVVGCPTASVMLSLRAVEHCLRKWYERDNESLDAGWGHVLDQLMEEYAEEEKRNDTVLTQLSDLPPVLSTLYHLKEKRNEVNHPDDSPSEQEARRTLMIVASTITEIHEQMREEAAKEVDYPKEFPEEESHRLEEINRETLTERQKVIQQNISEMSNTVEGAIPKTAIYELGESLNLSQEEVDEALRNLLMDGYIYEPSPDEIKPI